MKKIITSICLIAAVFLSSCAATTAAVKPVAPVPTYQDKACASMRVAVENHAKRVKEIFNITPKLDFLRCDVVKDHEKEVGLYYMVATFPDPAGLVHSYIVFIFNNEDGVWTIERGKEVYLISYTPKKPNDSAENINIQLNN